MSDVVKWTTTERVSAAVAVAALVGSVASWFRASKEGRDGRDAAARAEARADSAVRTAKRANRLAKAANRLGERKAVAQEEMASVLAQILEKQDRQEASSPQLVHVLDRLATASMSSEQPSPAAAAVGVRWTIHRSDKNVFDLLNIGDAVAHDVTIDSHNAVRLSLRGEPSLDEVAPGQSVPFLAIGSWGSGTPEVEVAWTDDPEGERRAWRRIVP